jgi:hypothetical protein
VLQEVVVPVQMDGMAVHLIYQALQLIMVVVAVPAEQTVKAAVKLHKHWVAEVGVVAAVVRAERLLPVHRILAAVPADMVIMLQQILQVVLVS